MNKVQATAGDVRPAPAPRLGGNIAFPSPIARAATPWRLWLRTRFGFAAVHAGILFAAFLGLRLVLALAFRPDGTAGPVDYLLCFLTGALRDAVVALACTLPLLVWLLWFPQKWYGRRWHRWTFLTAYALTWFAQIVSLAAEYFFFEEFKSRFNTVAIDYLIYPHEVFINIWDSYPVPLVLGLCAALAVVLTWLSQRIASEMWQVPIGRRARWQHFGAALALQGILLSLFELVPAKISRERLVNELSNNGAISFLAAAWTRNLDYSAFYPVMSRAEAFVRSRRLLAEPGAEFTGPADSLARHISGDPTRTALNVVLLLEESLGSEFFGSLGRPGQTLTPELDKLSEEGLFFVNMYATGNRTVRGFEGVLASFPPLPGDSIVKRDRSENVETIARVLQRDGYNTVFLYGGRGAFDGMRAFAVNNGYKRFIEQKDFSKPTFTTSWGVCNEDLYQRTLAECREMHRMGQPFFATVLSVSNHKPFTYPPGRIAEKPQAQKRRNAVKYTDWALGQFFAAAKKEPFWTNTLFVVVADHGARVYGSQSIPIHSYEIPLLILGPAVAQKPARLPQLGSQMDVAPTILGLLGRPYDSIFFGHDLLQSPGAPGRVLLNHNREIGISSGDRLVVLSLNKKLEYYHGDRKTGALVRKETPDAMDRELESDATALFQTADALYMQRRYSLASPLHK